MRHFRHTVPATQLSLPCTSSAALLSRCLRSFHRAFTRRLRRCIHGACGAVLHTSPAALLSPCLRCFQSRITCGTAVTVCGALLPTSSALLLSPCRRCLSQCRRRFPSHTACGAAFTAPAALSFHLACGATFAVPAALLFTVRAVPQAKCDCRRRRHGESSSAGIVKQRRKHAGCEGKHRRHCEKQHRRHCEKQHRRCESSVADEVGRKAPTVTQRGRRVCKRYLLSVDASVLTPSKTLLPPRRRKHTCSLSSLPSACVYASLIGTHIERQL